MAQNIARLNLHKIYLPDFLDVSEDRNDRSAFAGAAFSKTRSEHARSFEVIDRVAARKSYQILGITPNDLEKQEALLRIGRTNGAAAIVSGVVSVSDASETVSISIREISEGRDLYHTQYQQRRNAGSDDSFPSPSDPSGLFFNFPGFDGITVPKCVSCPNPEYSEEARRSKLSGVVLLSAVFTSQGTVEQVCVTRSVESSVNQAALNAVKRWRVNPAKDSSGAAVSVRVVVEVRFAIK